MPDNEYVELDLDYLHTSTKAILFQDSDEKEVWIPKSLISLSSIHDLEDVAREEPVTIQVQQWFAEKEGLV